MIVEDLPDVPPAVLLLFSEIYAKCANWDDARKSLRALLPELKAQSLAYDVQRFDEGQKNSGQSEFDIHLDGALNFFSSSPTACQDVQCRVLAAERTARSIGLIADRMWVTDYLTEKFCDFGRVTNVKLDAVIADNLVLGVLMPLVFGGVLRFKSPWIPSCKGCIKQFDDQVERISDALLSTCRGDFHLEDLGGDRYAIHAGAIFDPPMVLRVSSDSVPDVNQYAKSLVLGAIHSSLWVGREAAAGHGSVFSSSRVGLAGLAYGDQRVRSFDELRILDEGRRVDLPWVQELNTVQIMELRDEASKALPQFRELLASRLVYRDGISLDGSSIDLVGELRQQAAEVRDELNIINKNSQRFWKKSFTLLSLGAAVLGVAADQPLGAVGGLLALWQFLGTHDHDDKKDIDKLTCRPGYVLVKAHELLAHAS